MVRLKMTTRTTSTPRAATAAVIAVRQLLNIPTASTIVSASTHSTPAASDVASATSRLLMWSGAAGFAVRAGAANKCKAFRLDRDACDWREQTCIQIQRPQPVRRRAAGGGCVVGVARRDSRIRGSHVKV